MKNHHNSGKPYFCLINRPGIEHGCCETTFALVNESGYNYFLDKLEEQKGITVLELKNIEGDVEKLVCDSCFNEILNYREKQRMESSSDSEEQEGFTIEVLEGKPNKTIKLKSLSKKEDLLKIVKENQNVIIVHRKENQKGSGPIGCDIFPLCEKEREIVKRALLIYQHVDDNLFTAINYESFLDKLKAQKDITILELENIKGEVKYLLKPVICGYLRREDFAASVVNAKKEETKLITTQNDQPHSPDGSASSQQQQHDDKENEIGTASPS